MPNLAQTRHTRPARQVKVGPAPPIAAQTENAVPLFQRGRTHDKLVRQKARFGSFSGRSRRPSPSRVRLQRSIPGAPRRPPRMAVSEGWLEPRMFPGVPGLFPGCSQLLLNEFFAFPLFWISGHDPYGRSGLVMAISSALGTLGTLGTGLECHELGTARTWNRRGTLGTTLLTAGMLHYRQGRRFRIASFPKCLSVVNKDDSVFVGPVLAIRFIEFSFRTSPQIRIVFK